MQALLLAGGRGMGLKPLTDEVPQALLYLPGGTILDYLLHHISLLPVSETAVVLQYGGDRIARHLGRDHAFHLIPQTPPFTVLGALASAASWVREPTLVLHGDYYFSQPLTPLLAAVDPARPTFFVPTERGDARGQIAQSGAYVLPPAAFELAAEMAHEPHFDRFIDALGEAGMPATTLPLGFWARHVAVPPDLLAVNHYLLTHWHEASHPPGANRGYDALNFNWIAPDAQVDNGFNGLFVTIGPKATVHASRLYNSLLLPGVVLQGIKEQNVVLAGDHHQLLRLYGSEPVRSGVATH